MMKLDKKNDQKQADLTVFALDPRVPSHPTGYASGKLEYVDLSSALNM